MAVNPDIAKERKQGSFNPDDLTCQIFGREGMLGRRLAHERAGSDPDFKIAEKFSTMPRDEVYDQSVRIYTSFALKAKAYGYEKIDSDERNFYMEAAFIDSVYPFGLHHSMFIPTIKSQGTDEQIAEFLPKAERLEIIGTYAQTEIGHGTFLRGLETTATYDRATDQFILHSPTVTSIKCWPGGLGKTSNYAVVMAQLIIDGKQHGMNVFMCQLRDLKDHEPMPGVELGDINSKFGYENMDNGFLKFTHYRIPRTNMLMKYAQVSADGKFTREKMPQLAYLSMVLIRMLIVLGSSNDLAMAATIATRYSAVRRQTANSKGIEPQVLDYQTQQMKVFPAISSAYALFFTGLSLRQIYTQILSEVETGDVSRLAEIHALTSGLKAFSSELASHNIEVCRRACGGHGYSHASGIPKIYLRCVPGCTYEGENTVMYLQCARSLLKFLSKAQAEEPLPVMLKFLAESPVIPDQLKTAKKFNFDLYKMAYKYNSLLLISTTAGHMQQSIYNDGKDPENAWNSNSQELVVAAKAFAHYLTVLLFTDIFNAKDRKWEPSAKAVMSQICEFYAVNGILENCGNFLQNGVLTSEQINVLTERRVELLAELRPNAVTLVDAFDFPDRLLNSCLGRYDGQVYDALYEYAKSSSLNQHQVHPSFNKYVKPMREALKAKM